MIIRITWKRAILTLTALFTAGMVFACSGTMQVSASSGHWKITDWFLHWVMRNSVRTYSTFQTPEGQAHNRDLVSAAGHFRQACQVCHGAPGVKPSPVMQASTPPAPDLSVTAKEWTDRELFWIIRHGVKFTAMPAWPAEDRDDEVWRMVGFVRRLPGMTAEQYRALTQEAAPADLPGMRPETLSGCAACHGSDGRGRGQPDIPVLGGQSPTYLLAALRDYAAGTRQSAPMQVAAAALGQAEMEKLAVHFGAMPGLESGTVPTLPIIAKGDPARQLPACGSCHAEGKNAPVLSGQRSTYLAARLRQWQGDPTVVDARKPAHGMAVIARRIPPDQIDEIAAAFSSQSPTDRQR